MLLSLLLVLVAAPAHADKNAAKALAGEGAVHYKLGRFQEAFDAYSKAYESFPTPGLLFNLGQCEKMLKNHERAVFYFEGYLRDQPRAPNRALVESLIAESKGELQKQQAEEARVAAAEAERRREEAETRAREAEQQRRAEAEARLEAERRRVEAEARIVAERERAERARRGGTIKLASGLAVAGVGAALLSTGIYFGLQASSASDEINRLRAQNGTWSDHYQTLFLDGQRNANVGIALDVVGGVALVAGTVLAIFGGRERASAQRTFAARVAPGAAMMVSTWSF